LEQKQQRKHLRYLASGQPHVQRAEQLFRLFVSHRYQRTEMLTSLSQARAHTKLRTLDLPSSSGGTANTYSGEQPQS
jgi:hypothetical protein